MAWTGSAQLRRDPDDTLRLKIERPHLVFASGEEAEVELEFNLLTEEPQVLATRLEVELRHTRAAEGLSEHERLDVPTNAANPVRRRVRIRMPDEEGAYELVVRAVPAGSEPLVRRLEFVVVNPSPATAAPVREPVKLLLQEIDPTPLNLSPRWYSTRRLFGRTSRIGQFLWTSIRHPFGSSDRAAELPANFYRLNVQHPDRPHLLSVEFEDDGATLVAASIHAGIRGVGVADLAAAAAGPTGVLAAAGAARPAAAARSGRASRAPHGAARPPRRGHARQRLAGARRFTSHGTGRSHGSG